jgi:hypothetical protein
LTQREPAFAEALRGSLDDALDAALRRLERLLDSEHKALAAARLTLTRLEKLHAAIDAHAGVLNRGA